MTQSSLPESVLGYNLIHDRMLSQLPVMKQIEHGAVLQLQERPIQMTGKQTAHVFPIIGFDLSVSICIEVQRKKILLFM